MRRKRSKWTQYRQWLAPALAVAAAVAAAVGGIVASRRSSGGGSDGGGGGSSRPLAQRLRSGGRKQPPQDARHAWKCECGQAYLVSGRDRHTIFWLEGADEGDPLLADACPNCDRNLSAQYRHPAQAEGTAAAS